MPYIKLLTVLAGLALLTACGGAAPPNAEITDNDKTGGPAVPCDTNPYGADCGTEFQTQRLNIVSDCREDDSGELCEDAIEFTCDDNFRDSLCDGIKEYEDMRQVVQNECLTRATQTQCDEEARVKKCDASPFFDDCTEQGYVMQRRAECESLKNKPQCMATEELICGANGNVLLPFCDGITAYYDTLKTKCGAGMPKRNMVDCEFTIARICTNGDIFDDFCTGLPTTNDDRQTMCLADIMEDDSCRGEMGIATVFCKANLFDTSNACMADTYLPARIAECIMAGNAGESKCDTVSTDDTMNDAITACLENPFATACESVTAFMSNFALARTNRLEFCNDNMNVANDLCTDTNLMNVCVFDPFNAICFTGNTYLPTRLGECIKAENAEDMRCNTLLSDSTMNTTITACLTNPFTDACASNADFMTYAGDARTNRVSFCGTIGNESKAPCTALTTCQENLFAPTCGAYFESARIMHCMNNKDVAACPNATFGDWVASFTSSPLATAPVNLTSTTARDVRFLKGLTKTAPVITGFTIATDDFATLTLAHSDFDGDGDDGVSFFKGGYAGKAVGYYAGLLPDTDVGVPLDNVTQSGTWSGRFQALINVLDDEKIDVSFPLRVNFGMKTIYAFLENAVNSTHSFEIDGSFADSEVLSGSVNFARDDNNNDMLESTENLYIPGVLTGLIGSDGAVGAFHGTINNGNGILAFSGGFVAAPSPCQMAGNCMANHAAWLASFEGGDALPTTPNTTPTNQFLEISATTASTLTPGLVPTTLFMTGSTTNGAAFFIENGAYYAGILAGTNLGAPITEIITAEANVKWTGQIRAVSNNGDVGFTKTDFELGITFNGATGTMHTFFETAGGYYLIDGDFDAKGIISGNIAFAIGATGSGDSRTINTGDANYSPGTLTGIIGQGGAVGAFHSGHATLTPGNIAHFNPYAGGFVVKPSPCQMAGNCVNHADWLASFNPAPPAARTTGTDTFGGFLNLGDGVRDISPAGLTNTNEDRHLTLDGDGENGMHGVTYLAGRNGTNQQAFVAVLPTTNLGAPLTQASGTATWHGTYYNSSLVRDENNIPFLIDFGAKTITASRLVSLGPSNITTTFALNFTPATGVITGTVSEGSTPATARGLIGEKGLVGVYVDTRTGRPGGSGVVYGGFIADNPNN